MAVTMLATCVVAGTMAKYTSSGTAKGLKLTVASWNVEVAGTPIHDTISLDGVEWQIQSIDGIIPEPNPNRAAPGTWGYADISIVNNSDVDANITVSGLNSLIPSDVGTAGLSFNTGISDDKPSSYEDLTETAESFELAKSEDTDDTDGIDGTVKYICVCYKWEFDGYDDYDTPLGESRKIFDFDSTLKITAEQSNGA